MTFKKIQLVVDNPSAVYYSGKCARTVMYHKLDTAVHVQIKLEYTQNVILYYCLSISWLVGKRTILRQHYVATTLCCVNTMLHQHYIATTLYCDNTMVRIHYIATTLCCGKTVLLLG